LLHIKSVSGFGDIRIVRGPRYQRGYGFGSFFSRLAMPVIRYLGKEALNKGVSIGKRVVQDPQIQQAFKDSVKDLANKGLAKIKEKVVTQEGSGRKRLYKRRQKSKPQKSLRKVKKHTLKRVSKKKGNQKEESNKKTTRYFQIMEYIHASSSPATIAELDLFQFPPTQTVIESIYDTEYRPIGSIAKANVF
uniref:Uncharacterized protein n=1 Tax=Tetranychus urticae TaxID=32264 RepID=A0A158P5F5_TETUR